MLANKVRLAAVVVAACGVAGGRLAAQGLRNGGFEEVSDSDTVQGWHAVGSFACDTEQVRGGARSIRCEVPQRGANGRGGVMQEIVYGRPDTTPIMFGGWSRAEDVMAAEYCIYLDKKRNPRAFRSTAASPNSWPRNPLSRSCSAAGGRRAGFIRAVASALRA